MKRTSWLLGGVIVASAGLMAIGCSHDRGCRGGSCSAPSYVNPSYSAPAYTPPPTSAPTYTEPSYAPPSGSGARSAPMLQGSGSR